ncbi:hypothetical protein L596_001059 [Steinernema carpocapsae]|uniref:Uncharacterized protein n=1 Tax=Steinernema carpocapsae TaxID=34508 RepID=A0A4U8UJV8_STECR|nr:hypothetical protein L596_001059 [Steinernema carpocapsae]
MRLQRLCGNCCVLNVYDVVGDKLRTVCSRQTAGVYMCLYTQINNIKSLSVSRPPLLRGPDLPLGSQLIHSYGGSGRGTAVGNYYISGHPPGWRRLARSTEIRSLMDMTRAMPAQNRDGSGETASEKNVFWSTGKSHKGDRGADDMDSTNRAGRAFGS